MKLLKEEEFSRCSTQINLTSFLPKKVTAYIHQIESDIPDDCVYQDEANEYGRERGIHCTVLYGLINESEYSEIKKAVSTFGVIDDISFGQIDSFRNEGKQSYDVLKVEVISDKLNRLHYYLKDNFENKETFSAYKPHMTLAYIQPDTCKNLEGDWLYKGLHFSVSMIWWSSRNGTQYPMPLY